MPSLTQYSQSQRKPYSDKISESNDEAGSSYLAVADTMPGGERIATVNIAPITVVSKMRSVAERMGRVTLDFVVTLPKELVGRSRSVEITPVLHGVNGDARLEDLVIRGGLFSRLQQRDYWQYETYVDRFDPDSAGKTAVFERFVKFPYPKDARLDSVVERRGAMTYYYSQDVGVDEEAKLLSVTLQGRIIGIDGTVCTLPSSDTVSYTISSLLSFVDAEPRYLTEVVEKYVTVKDRKIIRFLAGDTRLIDTLGDNREQLGHIAALMRSLLGRDEFEVDAVTLTATASPHGSHTMNERLARGRACALKKYLTDICGDEIDTVLTVKWIAEDWDELAKLVGEDSVLTNRSEILNIITSVNDPDSREAIIRRRYPRDYARMRDMYYPRLRAVEMSYDLHRVGMVKDTIHTTVLDTVYMRGVGLLLRRKYAVALDILGAYNDRNTAIACMSSGNDLRAYELLSGLPHEATTEYLLAIVCARLHRTAEGCAHLREACRMDERLAFRADLDPEITNLLKD
jgi:hypothetical protein